MRYDDDAPREFEFTHSKHTNHLIWSTQRSTHRTQHISKSGREGTNEREPCRAHGLRARKREHMAYYKQALHSWHIVREPDFFLMCVWFTLPECFTFLRTSFIFSHGSRFSNCFFLACLVVVSFSPYLFSFFGLLFPLSLVYIQHSFWILFSIRINFRAIYNTQ